MSRDVQYIGMDVHKEAIVIAVINDGGKLMMESIIATKARSILQFIHGLRGELHVTWEEGTWAAWLYDSLQPHVHQVLVCDPRRNAGRRHEWPTVSTFMIPCSLPWHATPQSDFFAGIQLKRSIHEEQLLAILLIDV